MCQIDSTPPCAVSKTVVLDVACGGAPPCVGVKYPPFVSSVTNAYARGKLGAFDNSANASSDPRALQPPSGTGPRAIGKLAEGVIIAIDIATPDPTEPYTLTAYFVDFERSGRTVSVTLLNATDDTFNVISDGVVLENFGEGVYEDSPSFVNRVAL